MTQEVQQQKEAKILKAKLKAMTADERQRFLAEEERQATLAAQQETATAKAARTALAAKEVLPLLHHVMPVILVVIHASLDMR